MEKTITDIANELGVSVSTVSKVINNRAGVGPELRKRICDYIEEVNYRPNAIAQSMIKGRTNIVGLVFGDVRNPFYADLLYYIQQGLRQHGYMVMAFNSDYEAEKEVEFINQAIQSRYAGLMLITAKGDSMLQAISNIRAAKMPLVLVNRTLKDFNGSFVSVDNFQAGYMAAKHLIELGHRRLAFITGNMESSAGYQRFMGYKQALENYDIRFEEEQVYNGDLKFETGVKIAGQYIRNLETNPTGIVICNDLMAMGFIDYSKKHGIKIPEQLSVISFDNITYADLYGMELTTVDQYLKKMCACAVKTLLQQIENPGNTEILRTMIEPTLVVRGTTARYTQESALAGE